jgi:TPR repeat protein
MAYDIQNTDIAAMGATGNPETMFELGVMYATGRAGGLDLVTAHKWFNLAALKGNEAAKTQRLEISSQMSKEEIASAQRAAREWITLH